MKKYIMMILMLAISTVSLEARFNFGIPANPVEATPAVSGSKADDRALADSKSEDKTIIDRLEAPIAKETEEYLSPFDEAMAAIESDNFESFSNIFDDDLLEMTDKSRGFTLLHAAAFDGREKIVRYLLSKGAQINVQTKKFQSSFGKTKKALKRTPLHLAAKRGHAKIVSLLMHENADINATCKWGERYYTAHEIAIIARQKAVIKLFEEYIRAKDKALNKKDADDHVFESEPFVKSVEKIKQAELIAMPS